MTTPDSSYTTSKSGTTKPTYDGRPNCDQCDTEKAVVKDSGLLLCATCSNQMRPPWRRS